VGGDFATEQNSSARCFSRDPGRVGALDFFRLISPTQTSGARESLKLPWLS